MKHVKFCPKCKSLDIRSHLIGFFGFPAKYKCRNCGYSAFIFPALTMEQLKKLGNKRSDRK
jgi:DNA-directed RNA polymerase subunit M/transcription elongation factor TFIIS